MENQTHEVAVKKTVQFWVDKSFYTPMNQNNGDNTNPMMGILMNTVSAKAQERNDVSKIAVFEQKLTELLMNKSLLSTITLSVDYHPCEILSEAAEFAKIDTGCFPCKTFTQLKGNSAIAKYQYGTQPYTL